MIINSPDPTRRSTTIQKALFAANDPSYREEDKQGDCMGLIVFGVALSSAGLMASTSFLIRFIALLAAAAGIASIISAIFYR